MLKFPARPMASTSHDLRNLSGEAQPARTRPPLDRKGDLALDDIRGKPIRDQLSILSKGRV